MLNTNNEINIKKEERKHSWSTVFAWLYLKTIGRILPKRWNRWAENILYYDKTTANNEVQTDAFKTVDESVQVDLKPEVTEKESQSVVISKDGGVQTDGVTFQDTAMQTECVEKIDKNIEADLKPEVAEKDGEITSEEEGICSEVSGGSTDESFNAKLNGGFIDEEYNSMEGVCTEDDKSLQLAEVERDYTELKNVSDQIEKEFSDELEELRNEIEKNSVEMKKKDAIINILTALNEALKQNVKEIETRSNEQQQIAEIYMKLSELLLNVTEISEKTLQLNNQELQEEKKSLENKVLELQKQAQALEGNKEWELAGIDGILKEVFSNTMEMLEKRLYAVEGRNESLKRQLTTRSTEIEELNKQLEKVNEELEKLTLSYDGQADQIEDLQLEIDFLEEQNRELRSRNGKLESEVARLKEESIQSKVEFASGMVKALEDSEKKCMKTGSLTLLDEELSASVEKLSDQLYKVRSIERQQPQSTQGSKQQLEGETIDLEGKLKIEQSQKEQKQIEKLEEKQLTEMDSLKKLGSVSLVDTVSTAKSNLSGLSKAQNFIGKLFSKNKNLERFLSKKNEELKRDFPEFKGKHFCHNVLDKAIESLSNQGNSKFESSKLLKLLENNLTESARDIIDTKVKEVVNEHCNIGKNIGKELRDDTLKTKLSSSVGKCIKKLELNEKDNAIVVSILNSFYSKNNNSNDLKKLLGEIIVEKLTEVKMKCFSSEIQELQLASSIRDKFLSPDQKMCNQICGKENVYQLRAGINKTNDIPNSFMSRTSSTASINSLNIRVGS